MKYSLSGDFLNPWKILFHSSEILTTGSINNIAINPVAVEIHPTTMCNHRCIHCSYMDRNENRISLSLEIMEKLVDSLINMNVKSVYFSGGGEPTVYPNLYKYIKKLSNANVDVALLTNGSLMIETGIIDCCDCFKYIAISVPSANKNNFEYITGSDNFDKVLSCPQLIKTRYGEKAPIVGARVVITSIIYREIPDIIKALFDKSFDYVNFKVVRDYEDRGLGLKDTEITGLREMIESLKPIDSDFTNLETIFNYRNIEFTNSKCFINEAGLIANINSDGKVYPNIVEIGDEQFCIGNLYNESLEQMWHGSMHKKVKFESARKWENRECKNCRSIAYNQILYELLSKMPSGIDNFI